MPLHHLGNNKAMFSCFNYLDIINLFFGGGVNTEIYTPCKIHSMEVLYLPGNPAAISSKTRT